jgi:hypothetical protein
VLSGIAHLMDYDRASQAHIHEVHTYCITGSKSGPCRPARGSHAGLVVHVTYIHHKPLSNPVQHPQQGQEKVSADSGLLSFVEIIDNARRTTSPGEVQILSCNAILRATHDSRPQI